MTLRVLGVDPGLTRCGIGIVDVDANRKARLVAYSVIRTPIDADAAIRLLAVSEGIEAALELYQPQAMAVERVFAQNNLRTVMGTAQASGIALAAAARRGIPVKTHTPSEVKAAITGYGGADKKQVAAMVARVLGLAEPPKPADAADAVAIAICHAWRSGGVAAPGLGADLTPAQKAWQAAERSSRR